MNIDFVANSNSRSSPAGKLFLDWIPSLTAEERSMLSSLTADSPAALWAMIKASPEPFARILGPDRTHQVATALWNLIPSTERQYLQEAQFVPPPMGVAVGEPAETVLSEPRYDMTRRDELHSELKRLRSQNNPDAKSAAAHLESELRALLKGNRKSC